MKNQSRASSFEIIPAIDLRGGKCVRLFQGRYDQETIYSDDPVAVACRWEEAGAPRLHVVDLDGAREGNPANLDVAARIVSAISMPADFGGGIRAMETARRVMEAGFQRFSIGTRALDEEFASEIFQQFGDAAILDIAARDGLVSVAGWQEQSSVKVEELAKGLVKLGCGRIIFTDISRDGALSGPNIPAAVALAKSVGIPIVLSGGVSSVNDLLDASRCFDEGIEGAITGRALYDGRINLKEAIEALKTVNA